MSSTYRWICVDHTPPLILDEIERHLMVPGSLPPRPSEHPECKLLIGRWSGGLVEINPLRYGYDEWVDVDWLRHYPKLARLIASGVA